MHIYARFEVSMINTGHWDSCIQKTPMMMMMMMTMMMTMMPMTMTMTHDRKIMIA